MPVATIVAQYVNPPAAGRKSGSIKTPEGEYYNVLPAMLAQFQQGGTYTVNFKDRIWNSKTYHDIDAIISVDAAPAAKSGGKYGPTDDATAERILVCGALNSFIQAGKIEPTRATVTKAIEALRGAWADTFGKKTAAPAAAKPAAKETMDDEIPF